MTKMTMTMRITTKMIMKVVGEGEGMPHHHRIGIHTVLTRLTNLTGTSRDAHLLEMY